MDQIHKNFAEIGIAGFDFSGDFVRSDFLPQLNWPQAGKVYEEMSKNDPTIGAILYMSKQLVRRVGWNVLPKGDDKQSIEAAEFVRSCMDDMDISWGDFIGELLSMLVYGWSYHEVVYKIRKGSNKDPRLRSKHRDGKIGWRKIAGRSQLTCYGWQINQVTGDIEALIQQAAPDYGQRFIPIEKSIHIKTESDFGNPYGRSLLRNAYRPWFFKKRIEEIEGIGIERDLAGLPVLIPPEGLDIWDSTDPSMVQLKNLSEQLVKNIRRDQSEGVVHPNGWELKLLSTGSQRQFDTNEILNRYDQRIAITLLADIVMLGADKVGSFALADVKKSLLCASLETVLATIASALNSQELPRLLELNGMDVQDCPTIKADEIETPDLEQLSKLLTAMSSVGMKVSDPTLEEFLRRVASMPANSEEVIELKREIFQRGLDASLTMTTTNGTDVNESAAPTEEEGEDDVAESPDSENE